MVNEIPNFISKKDCKSIIKMIDQTHSRSLVSGAGDVRSDLHGGRTSSTSNLDSKNPIIKRVHKKIAKHLNLNLNQGESLQGQLYEPGQFFHPHTDFFQGDSFYNHCLHSGNRTHTFMIYLNVPEEGGETNFPTLDLSFSPKEGTAISWLNMKDGKVLPEMLHEGSEVKKGKKYIITSWWREKEWDGSEDDRLAKLFHEEKKSLQQAKLENKVFTSREDFPKFTEKGFMVVKVPPTEWGIINDAYQILKDNPKDETFSGVKSIIPTQNEEYGSQLMSLDNLPTLKNLLHKSLQPLHEEWSGQSLDPSAIYGIRSYKKGSSLINHSDRLETHHISSIIIVDKNLDCGCTRKKEPEDWPLHIQSHDGEWHKIYAEPGDMILYESISCLHGRPDIFKGKFFRNFYIHYKLKDWTYQP